MVGMPAGAKNCYYCETCGRYTVTVHADEGVTPMFLACRATGDISACGGRAVSMMYRPEPWPDHVPSEPQFEWFMPSKGAIWRSLPEMRQHYEMGGLELRRIGGEAEKAPAGPRLPRKERRAQERAAKKGRKP